MKIVHINNVFVVVENGRKETGHNILDEKDPQEGKKMAMQEREREGWQEAVFMIVREMRTNTRVNHWALARDKGFLSTLIK